MTDAQDVYILRHGQTEWNVAGRMQGALDSPLTDEGIDQALRMKTILDRIDLQDFSWVTSPQGRSRQTAELVRPGQTFTEDARLSEIDIGLWTGLTRDQIMAEAPYLCELSGDLQWYDHAPSGEGLLGLERRVRAFLHQAPQKLVLVTHGITSRVLRCCLLGYPVEAFEEFTGGQGIIYRISGAKYQKLTLHGTDDLS